VKEKRYVSMGIKVLIKIYHGDTESAEKIIFII